MPPRPHFRRVLVANRGEIARRVIRTCRRLGIETVAVHSEADANALYVREADAAVLVGPPPARESYLRVEAILAAARETGAEAVHPGYGLLSENAGFAEAVQAAGLVWIGPSPATLRAVGDKIAARRLAAAAGVPVLPGSDGPVEVGAEAAGGVGALEALAERVGFPLLVKAAGGGGGIGVELVTDAGRLAAALRRSADRGRSSFGDARVYLERFVIAPRHVELQILCGAGEEPVVVGERECSLQRRHQKILEETPAPGLAALGARGPEVRARLRAAAAAAARACGYVNAGTIEFLLEPSGDFWFLEVNARLQVEHPVTEVTTELDLVEEQIAIAAGAAPSAAARTAAASGPRGAAIECRVCAEDPRKRFAPSPGTITRYREPRGEGVRVDSGVEEGTAVTPWYDSLLAKVVAHGETRAVAVERMARALDEMVVDGPATNLPLLRAIVADGAFRAGEVHTGWLEPWTRKWAEAEAGAGS